MTTNSQVPPAYQKPWVIAQSNLDLLADIAQDHGFIVEIKARAGECFVIGSAEAEIGDGQIGVWVLGNQPLDPEQDINFFHEVDDTIRAREEQVARSKEAR